MQRSHLPSLTLQRDSNGATFRRAPRQQRRRPRSLPRRDPNRRARRCPAAACGVDPAGGGPGLPQRAPRITRDTSRFRGPSLAFPLISPIIAVFSVGYLWLSPRLFCSFCSDFCWMLAVSRAERAGLASHTCGTEAVSSDGCLCFVDFLERLLVVSRPLLRGLLVLCRYSLRDSLLFVDHSRDIACDLQMFAERLLVIAGAYEAGEIVTQERPLLVWQGADVSDFH